LSYPVQFLIYLTAYHLAVYNTVKFQRAQKWRGVRLLYIPDYQVVPILACS